MIIKNALALFSFKKGNKENEKNQIKTLNKLNKCCKNDLESDFFW